MFSASASCTRVLVLTQSAFWFSSIEIVTLETPDFSASSCCVQPLFSRASLSLLTMVSTSFLVMPIVYHVVRALSTQLNKNLEKMFSLLYICVVEGPKNILKNFCKTP